MYREPEELYERVPRSFISVERHDSGLPLDNDPTTLEKERTRIQNALSKFSERLRIVETTETRDGNGNVFVLNTLSRDFIEKIREYFTRNESNTRYEVSIETHELPLDHLKNDSMRFLQETVTVHRRAFKPLKRPFAKTLFVQGIVSCVALYLLYLIMRIGTGLFLT